MAQLKKTNEQTSLYSSGITSISGINTPIDASQQVPLSNHAMSSSVSVVSPHLHALNADEEYQYWEDTYVTRDYIDRSLNYGTHYSPAYSYGVRLFQEHNGVAFDDLCAKSLRQGWDQCTRQSGLRWDQAQDAVRDAYMRLYHRYKQSAI